MGEERAHGSPTECICRVAAQQQRSNSLFHRYAAHPLPAIPWARRSSSPTAIFVAAATPQLAAPLERHLCFKCYLFSARVNTCLHAITDYFRNRRSTHFPRRGRKKSRARRRSTFQCRVLTFPTERTPRFSVANSRHWNVELRFCARISQGFVPLLILLC